MYLNAPSGAAPRRPLIMKLGLRCGCFRFEACNRPFEISKIDFGKFLASSLQVLCIVFRFMRAQSRRMCCILQSKCYRNECRAI